MKTPVSLEIAKLLKIKGFDEPTLLTWIDFKSMHARNEKPYISENTKQVNIHESERRNSYGGGNSQEYYCRSVGIKDLYSNNSKEYLEGKYSAPTISDVIMWLYEKHGIWIQAISFHLLEDRRFSSHICFANNIKTSIGHSVSPTEAYLEAIKYVLNNSID
tara:strand:- start:5465 stop:5947 length:483 start_codon:yes stop_codon:yes gene_type:complete